MSERRLDCEQGDDAAAYVLRALDDAEAHAFGEHLVSCPICREEVAQLQSVADALAYGVPKTDAPHGLSARIMATVYAEAELLNAAGHDADRVAPARSIRRGLVPALAAAAALAAGLLVGAFAINTGSDVKTEVIHAEVVLAPGHHATATLRKVGGHLQLVLAGMPAPPAGRIYEVWLEHGTQAPEPTDALFSVTKTGAGSVGVPGNIQGVSHVLVTDEPLGGSPKPTRNPVIVAEVETRRRRCRGSFAWTSLRAEKPTRGRALAAQLGSCRTHGHLLPPPKPRDRRFLLLVRTTHLSRLHDHHPGRHARRPECARQRTRVVRMRELASVPRVTYALIAVNVFAYLAEGSLTVTSSGVLGDTLYDKGALLGSFPGLVGQGVAHGQWWRLLTSGFLHENIVHIGMNMLILYLLGRMIEPMLGSLKFTIVYFVSLLAGSFGALLLSPHTFTVGASGAIFGIAGAAVVELRARQISVMESGIGMLILLNLLLSFTVSGISIGGHIGGLIGGALAALALQAGERRRSEALGFAACALIAAACAAGAVTTAKSSDVGPPTGEGILLAPPQ